MSSQHLEEADELADRVLVMTKGQLLTLDTPQAIKEQFGVGYKILVEPRTDVISMQGFSSLKNELDNLIYRGHSAIKSCRESSDSTKKKLIYQIPFKDVELIANLL